MKYCNHQFGSTFRYWIPALRSCEIEHGFRLVSIQLFKRNVLINRETGVNVTSEIIKGVVSMLNGVWLFNLFSFMFIACCHIEFGNLFLSSYLIHSINTKLIILKKTFIMEPVPVFNGNSCAWDAGIHEFLDTKIALMNFWWISIKISAERCVKKFFMIRPSTDTKRSSWNWE